MIRSFVPAVLPGVRAPESIGAGDTHAAPADVLRRLSPGDIVLEDYRPLPLNLEWRLSDLYWTSEGVRPFIADAVPYAVNNDGIASTAAAAVLFANCVEAGTGRDPIHVLEVGAGTGLFALYLLDEFRDLCRHHGRDFYDRLVFHVSDRSPQTVRHWSACGLFGAHSEHVRTLVCHAEAPEFGTERPLRAVFAHYVLDSLPAAVLRRSGEGWQQLCARATIREDAVNAMGYGHRVEWLRQAARSNRTDDLSELLPLLPCLDSELAFLPGSGADLPGGESSLTTLAADAADGARIVYNYGALQSLDRLLTHLDATGFVLLRDFGNTSSSAGVHAIGPQRFGGATAVPVDFVRLEGYLRARSIGVAGPEREGLLHSRLLTVATLPDTLRTFKESFDTPFPELWELPARARQLAERGLFREALDVYRMGVDRSPRDWRLIGEAARFALVDLRDPEAGLGLARAALQFNPWYSPFLWNVLGDCLAALDRGDEAHDCYLQAHQLHPGGVETHLRLARSWLHLGDAARSLESVAHGLASDVDDMLRRQLLESQQAAIDALALARIAQRETTFRRRARADLPGRSGGD